MLNASVKIAQNARGNPRYRTSSDSVWPLRRADGTRFCDPKKETQFEDQ